MSDAFKGVIFYFEKKEVNKMALNLQDYDKTPWAPKMPITQDRMEKLEEGVYVNREALQSLDDSVTTIDANISTINSGLEARPTTTQVQALVQ